MWYVSNYFHNSDRRLRTLVCHVASDATLLTMCMCMYTKCARVRRHPRILSRVTQTRLAVMIEDPREVERRRQLGIEADIGCSREDLGDALAEVRDAILPHTFTLTLTLTSILTPTLTLTCATRASPSTQPACKFRRKKHRIRPQAGGYQQD